MMGYRRSLLQKIEEFAFCNCTSLSSITLPSTVTAIDYAAFANCNNVRKVVLNEGLQKIGEEAFLDCKLVSYFPLLLLK